MKNTGFTLIELIIVIVVIAILAHAVPMLSGGTEKKAEEEMREYVQKIYGMTDVNVSCKKSDTDYDRNIRCTASWDENGTRKVVTAECNYRASGCSDGLKL